MPPKSCRRSGTWAMPARTIADVGRPVILRPSNRMPPPDTATMPMTVLSNVLLPAPLAPISATISPLLTVSDTSRSTGRRAEPPVTRSSSSNALMDLRRRVVSQVSSDHLRVRPHLICWAIGNLDAVMHDYDAVGEPHHQPHVVLDQEHRDA